MASPTSEDIRRHAGHAGTLTTYDRCYEPLHDTISGWLAIAPDSRILDAGVGTGGITAALAAAAGPDCQLDALDIKSELFDNVRTELARRDNTAAVHFHEGSVLKLPFPDHSFDLVWCSRVIHGVGDQLSGARELVRVTKPGGRVALREGGPPLLFMPADLGIGAPGLENRLRVAQDRWFWQMREGFEGHQPYPYGWAHLLREAGCRAVTARTHVLDLLAPFTAGQQAYLDQQLRGPLTREEHRAQLDPADLSALERLCDQQGPDYLLARDDLHAILSATVYVGQV